MDYWKDSFSTRSFYLQFFPYLLKEISQPDSNYKNM